DLTDNALVADAVNKRGTTTLVIVAPETDHLFSYEGSFEIVEVEAANSNNMISVTLPSKTSLESAYPNPFNPSTTFSYILAETEDINLSVFNITGQLVESLVNNQQDAGSYTLVWDASLQPSGIYFLRLQAGNETFNQKLMVIK
ncbi:MAG: T9SS type A sorting domain-containing protein, partial [Candidatus Marinimicrobia bacterium]|nr:T9SS type A sorting domain-containing protein [Candidatus Neomarinimicrobiota bacterium]